MQKILLPLAGISGLLAVVFGAFGAHALEGQITEKLQAVYTTGVEYQFYHSIAMLLAILFFFQLRQTALLRAALFFALGILLFSGSLYLLSCRELIGLSNWKWLGPITPIGGTLFIVGWGFFAWGSWRGLAQIPSSE